MVLSTFSPKNPASISDDGNSPAKPHQCSHACKKLSNPLPCGSSPLITVKIIQWSPESVIWTAQLPPNRMEWLAGPFSQYLSAYPRSRTLLAVSQTAPSFQPLPSPAP